MTFIISALNKQIEPQPNLEFITLAGGLRMGFVEMGPESGEPIILLHGFPEFHWSYRFQWPALARAGFRVIVPDQRGYNRTDKTPPYDVDTLANDVIQLQYAFGFNNSHIVGHDWGAFVAWHLAAHWPERVNKLIIMNVPHENAMHDALRRPLLSQWLKSWYIGFFQLRGVAEAALHSNNFRALGSAFSTTKHVTPADLAKYKDAWAQPEAIKAMLGWYRALFRRTVRSLGRLPSQIVPVPTCVIWGEQDFALDKRCNDTLSRYVPDLQIYYLPQASHWVMMDEPEHVNNLMLAFLR